MPELMTKQDAVEYLLYMKHNVYEKSPMDIALDTAIEALKKDRSAARFNFCPNCGARIDGGDDNGKSV